MTTLPSAGEPHRDRGRAESFGIDAERYDRTRPRYPEALVGSIVSASPGPDVLDVGCGTGISARQFQAAGCRVLGIEPDARMADFARRGGLEVEVATFETWEPAGRDFDAVIAGQAWHWVDPTAGAAKAAQVLRPGGRLALFWNAGDPPPEAAEAFAAIYQRLMPGSLAAQAYRPGTSAVHGYSALFAKAAGELREASEFGDVEEWRFEWEHTYSRDEWLDQLPTTGALTQLPPDKLEEVLAATGAAIDALGGHFPMSFTAVAITTTRTARG